MVGYIGRENEYKRLLSNSIVLVVLWVTAKYWDGILFTLWWFRAILMVLVLNVVLGCWNWFSHRFIWSLNQKTQQETFVSDILALKGARFTPRTDRDTASMDAFAPGRTPVRTPQSTPHSSKNVTFSMERHSSSPSPSQSPFSRLASPTVIHKSPQTVLSNMAGGIYRPVSLSTTLVSLIKTPTFQGIDGISGSPLSSKKSADSSLLFTDTSSSVQYWTLEKACREYGNISMNEMSVIVNNLKKFTVTKLLRPFLDAVDQLDQVLSLDAMLADISNTLLLKHGNLVCQQGKMLRQLEARLGRDWIIKRLLAEDWLLVNQQSKPAAIVWALEKSRQQLDMAYIDEDSSTDPIVLNRALQRKQVAQWVSSRIADLAKFATMPTFECTPQLSHFEGSPMKVHSTPSEEQQLDFWTSQSTKSDIPLPSDTDILMHFFSCFMDNNLPKESSFRNCLFLDNSSFKKISTPTQLNSPISHSYVKSSLSEDPNSFLSSFIWIYPVVIRRIPTTVDGSLSITRYQIITSNRIIFMAEDPHNSKYHWFYILWFLGSFLQKEYAGYLG
jgi:hypothetical protein